MKRIGHIYRLQRKKREKMKVKGRIGRVISLKLVEKKGYGSKCTNRD